MKDKLFSFVKRNALLIGGVAVVVLAILLFGALYTMNQAQQAIVFQFGEPKRVVREPGLKIKMPFIQNVIFYEKRLLDVDPPAEEVILADQKRLVMDTYTRWRIADPLEFYKSVRTEFQARARLQETINSQLRQEMGSVTLPTVLSDDRADIMHQVKERVNAEVKDLGVAIKDVRIRRADLPPSTSKAIYERMKSEREREAREFRAQGQEKAQQIRSRADRERTVIVAEAKRQSERLRGEGDAKAIAIYADAYGQDLEFFGFYRALQAYREAFNSGDTSMVLSPDSTFFEFFKNLPGSAQ